MSLNNNLKEGFKRSRSRPFLLKKKDKWCIVSGCWEGSKIEKQANVAQLVEHIHGYRSYSPLFGKLNSEFRITVNSQEMAKTVATFSPERLTRSATSQDMRKIQSSPYISLLMKLR